jgi:putative ABC transport system permease protein
MRRFFFRERERKLDSELQFHLEQQIKNNVAAGMKPDEARRAATIEFGGLEQIKEQCRDERSMLWIEQTWQDFRYACRQLARSPGFTAIALLTLALGIGATTAIFSVVNSVLLKPLPYRNSERVVNVRETRLPKLSELPVAPANFRDWSSQATDVFESIYAEARAGMNLTGSGEPIRVGVGRVSRQFFEALGESAMLGRVFGAEEDAPGRNNVVVLNHGFWLRQFGGRPDILGASIQLSGQPYTVIGIMPPNFQRESGKDLLTPLAFTKREWAARSTHMLAVFASLKPGATIEQAQTRMNVIAAQLARQYPDTNRDAGIGVVSLLANRTASSRGLLFTFVGAVSLLLLLACTNVANLLLARATTRQREISVRSALGATRGRIARQLLLESVVLSLGGALLGLVVAKAGLTALLVYAPSALPRGNFEIVLDSRAVFVTVGLAILTGLGFGLVPAVQSTRVDLTNAMKQGGRGEAGSQRNRTRNVLVVVEVALALVLLAGAGLLIRSFMQFARFDPGFNPHGTLVVGLGLPREKYNTPEKQSAFADAALERYRRMPGVISAAVAQSLPLAGGGMTVGLQVEGRSVPPSEIPTASYFPVSPDFFLTLAIRLVHGRLFSDRDRIGTLPVVVISQSAADQFFPGADPIGQRIALANSPQIWREIVGVVTNVRPYDVDQDAWPQVYAPFAQSPSTAINFLVRMTDEAAPKSLLRQQVYAVDPDQPVIGITSFDSVLVRAFSRQRFALMLFATFSAIALLLAMTGIYGVMAFSVSRRTAEFGVRIALGARPTDIVRLILGEAGRVVASGVLLGVLGALVAGRFMESLLYRTPSNDPIVLTGITLLLFAVALIASFLPAWRATKVDPMIALRAD